MCMIICMPMENEYIGYLCTYMFSLAYYNIFLKIKGNEFKWIIMSATNCEQRKINNPIWASHAGVC